MSITRDSVHVSTPYEKLYRDLMFGCQTLDKGVAQFLPMMRKQITLNRFYSDVQLITERVPTPTTPNDGLTKDEKQLILNDIMSYNEFDPMEFNVDWEFLWAVGPQVSQEAAGVLLEAIRESVVTSFNYDLDQLLWNGDTTSGNPWLAPIDGFVKIIDNDGDVISVAPAGAITEANVISILEAVVNACPAEVREMSSPAILCNHKTKYLYESAQRALDFKGVNVTEGGVARFGGYPIVSINAIPDDRVFMGNIGSGESSNFKVGGWMERDRFNLKIERLQANSDLFFYKIGMGVGCQTIYGKELVEYSPA